jgi:uncharacterized membrane protein HdeD (DUF308 family)
MIQQTLDKFMANKTKTLIRFETISLTTLGILTMIFPHSMEVGFNYAFGTLCIILGISELVNFALVNDGTTPATQWLPFMTALTGISVGVVMYVDGMFFIKTFISTWLFSFGAFQIFRAIRQIKTTKLWALTAFCGLSALFFAMVMLLDWPVDALSHVGFFIGPNLIITAITLWFNNRQVFKTSSK